jgi:hypothetical protein
MIEVGDGQRPPLRIKRLTRATALLAAFLAAPISRHLDRPRNLIPVVGVQLAPHRH